MKNEFEKLDNFMRKHTPPLAQPTLPRPQQSLVWKGFAFACLLSVVVITAVQIKQNSYDENALALSEIMEWDVTTDEMPVDVEDLIAWTE